MRGVSRTLLLLMMGVLALAAPLSAQLPPDARWRGFESEHFRVTYAPGLEELARRAAERAERAYATLAAELAAPPRGRIELVVTDNVDLANGYATPFPTNRVVIFAHPPVNEPSLAFYDDWLELVVTHELVHVFHLDHARGIWRPLRALLGRNPALFPQAYSPSWVVEGLATYFESRLTQAGRVRGTLHDMALRTAILDEAFFSIDRATGSPVTWPAGSTRYIYGSLFVQHLASTYGAERVPAFVREVGRQLVPYRPDAAARRAIGVSFSRAWRAWEDSLRTHYHALADSLRAQGLTEPEILTGAGRLTMFPRYAPSGDALAYVSANALDEPATRLLLSDGGERELAVRTSLGPLSWLPDGSGLLHGQLNFVDPYRIYGDLYRLGRDGEQERVTRGARLWEPSVHPDGRRVVAVGNAEGTNVLLLRDLQTGEERRLSTPSLDRHWAAPRWSPDGRWIAAARWEAGGRYDVVVLDSTGAVVRQLTSDRAVDSDPSWSPDGRYVVFASDRTGIPNLFAYDLEAGRLLQVTNVLTGAFQPDVSPDGRWIAFAYYQADGYHVARLPFDPSGWRDAPSVRSAVGADPSLDPARYAATAGGAEHGYSPWPSVAPAAWTPLVDYGSELELGLGAATYGEDVVQRHRWSAQALLYPSGTRLEGGLGYRYRGWGNPVLDVFVDQDWRVELPAGTEVGRDRRPLPTHLLRRERGAEAALTWQRRRWRSLAWAGVGAELLARRRVWDDSSLIGGIRLRQFPLDVGGSVNAGYSSARAYGISLGPQEGFTLSGALEGHRFTEPFEGEDEARGYLRLTGRSRAFHPLELPGFARHVLALRADAGADNGSFSPGFQIGGASGGRAPVPTDLAFLGRGLAYPVRGYPEGVQFGNRAVSVTGEYRFPLRLVERGLRTWPIFLDRVWGDVFADVGAAWCAADCAERFPNALTAPRPLYSVGAELMVDLDVGFFVDLPLRAGIAWPLKDPRERTPQLYVRVGRSF